MPSTPVPEQNSGPQFVQVGIDVIRKLREMKLSGAEMHLYFYLLELDPFGDRLKEMPSLKEIMMATGISKATFYRAISKFEEAGLYEIEATRIYGRNPNGSKASTFEPQKQKKKRLKNETTPKRQSQKLNSKSQICDSESQKCDELSQKRDSKSQICDSKSHPRDKRSLKVLPDIASGSPHNTHKIHTLKKEHTLSYPAWLGSMDEPAPPEELKKIADWVREEFGEWMELAKGFGFITGEITFSRKHRRPVLRREGKEPQLLDKLLEDHPLESLRSWLQEIESGIHAGK